MEIVERRFKLSKALDDAFENYCTLKGRDPNELVEEIFTKLLGLNVKRVKVKTPVEEGGLVRVGEVKKDPAYSSIHRQRIRGRRGQNATVKPAEPKKAAPKSGMKKKAAKKLGGRAKAPTKKTAQKRRVPRSGKV